ncbi:zinc finger BED domain-containing protein 5-like [Palaemon carinicauda]|uniref:zinc finger BED domain-containing protein 5-like n=1 Tax=Palaemon carinicauda TaxID=392227 RepID=UPI0035B5E6CB
MDLWLKTGSLTKKKTEFQINNRDSTSLKEERNDANSATQLKLLEAGADAMDEGNTADKPKQYRCVGYHCRAQANTPRNSQKEAKKEASSFFIPGENAKATESSYKVSLLIAKTGKAHSIGETLVKPAAKIMTEIILGEKASKEINKIPLSNDTVKKRITSMAENVKVQLVSQLQQREAIFNVANDFIVQNELSWSRCVGISTDGATAMTGKLRGLVSRVQSIVPQEELDSDTTQAFKAHLQGLHSELGKYFEEPDPSFEFIRNPFVTDKVDIEKVSVNLSSKEADNLVEIATRGTLKTLFRERSLANFWAQVQPEYPGLAEIALKHLTPFPTTYNCEIGFSTLVDLKTKKRNRISVEPDM